MTLLFLLLVVVAMPWLSYISFKNIHALEAANPDLRLSKKSIYLQSIGMQTGLSVVGYFAAQKGDIAISFFSSFSFLPIMAAIAFLILALSLAGLTQRANQKTESTLRYILPENISDRIFWIIAVLIAAFCEEYIYRGVLFQILLQQTNNTPWIAAVLASIIFGFGHGTQGEKAIIQIIPFAMGFHLLVYLSGGLIIPMIVHFIYNISVELMFGQKIRQKP